MKASKETKILAILLALFLLIGIGCGAAVATSDSANGHMGPLFIDTDIGAVIIGTFFAAATEMPESVLVAHVEGVQAHVEAATE